MQTEGKPREDTIEMLTEPQAAQHKRFDVGAWSDAKPLPMHDFWILWRQGALDRDESHNGAPSIGELLAFSAGFTGRLFLIGYRIAGNRTDERISIDGVLIEESAMTPAQAEWLASFGYDEKDPAGDGLTRIWWD